MTQSRGQISFHPLFTTDDIGVRSDASVDHVVKTLMHLGEANASRWIEMPKGILLLLVVPDEPASGALYLYDRERRTFFFVDFAVGRDDSFTTAEFEELVGEYDLISRAAHPELLAATLARTASA